MQTMVCNKRQEFDSKLLGMTTYYEMWALGQYSNKQLAILKLSIQNWNFKWIYASAVGHMKHASLNQLR